MLIKQSNLMPKTKEHGEVSTSGLVWHPQILKRPKCGSQGKTMKKKRIKACASVHNPSWVGRCDGTPRWN